MPAQSPTLSPTLSAITAGLRGSSSGIPASTLPTRSAPTSAALVKIPPPRRAKMEIRDAPKASATSASMTVRSFTVMPAGPVRYQKNTEIARRADRKSGVEGKRVDVRVDPGGRSIFKNTQASRQQKYQQQRRNIEH